MIVWTDEPGSAIATSGNGASYRYQFFTGQEAERSENGFDHFEQCNSVHWRGQYIYVAQLPSFHAGYDGALNVIHVPEQTRGLPVGLPLSAVTRIEQADTYIEDDQSLTALEANQYLVELNPCIFPLPASDTLVMLTSSRFRDGSSYELPIFVTAWLSTDGGYTWTDRTRIDVGTRQTVCASRGYLHLGDKLVVPWYTQDTGDDEYVARMYESDDGITWAERSVIASATDRQFSEASVLRLRSGRIIVVMRDDTTGSSGDHIHSIVYSSDDAQTWTSPVDGPRGNAFPALRQATDGTLYLLTRSAEPVGGGPGGGPVVYASTDDGATWGDAVPIGYDLDNGGWYMGGVLEEYDRNRLRAVFGQDLDTPPGQQNADDCGGFYAELSVT